MLYRIWYDNILWVFGNIVNWFLGQKILFHFSGLNSVDCLNSRAFLLFYYSLLSALYNCKKKF